MFMDGRDGILARSLEVQRRLVALKFDPTHLCCCYVNFGSTLTGVNPDSESNLHPILTPKLNP